MTQNQATENQKNKEQKTEVQKTENQTGGIQTGSDRNLAVDPTVKATPGAGTPKRRAFTVVDWVKVGVGAALLVACVLLIIRYFPFFLSLRDPEVRLEWSNQLRSMGVGGFFTALGMQVLQVVLAIIPGEAVEIAMGYLYGMWGGLGICLLGIFIGSCLILLLVRLLGVSFVRDVITEKRMDKLKFLHNTKSLETVVFVLFLIPGTPKDMLTYFIPLTSMKVSRFLVISTFARIPSVVTSTLIGASLGKSQWVLSIAIFALTAVIGIAGIYLNNWYMKRHDSQSRQ